jgi:Alw26I/Eco31I/Esp3I family type II restriction m6 adenine DNA methyltransferase
LILQKINHAEIPGSLPARHFDTVSDLLMKLDANLCHDLLHNVLPKLSLLDPACGSGAFLIAMMKTLIEVYSAIFGKIPYLRDTALKRELKKLEAKHANILYFIKKRIITDNIFGVDIMEEATEIARLRLFLTLVASAETVDELEPLPNIDFNILAGNSLLGLMQIDAHEFDNKQDDLFRKSYQKMLAEKNAKIRAYQDASTYAEDLKKLRDEIEDYKREAKMVLDEILLDDFNRLKIKFEQATWDDKKNKPGKPTKRPLQLADFKDLHLFHWGYEFDEVLNKKGGFDAIITNPPWEIFKPQAKEFFNDYSQIVTKNKMTIKEFEKEKKKLLQESETLEAWLAYQSRFPHLSKYFRLSSQYPHQIAVVNGKKTGSDINLYKLFLEQCFNLLRTGGQCGIVIPSGIYTDLGATGLRNLLFNETQMTGLFGFENRKKIFEGVDSRFKFVVLSFEKGGKTTEFPAAFMRHDVNELAKFPKRDALRVKTDLIYRLSPDSHSVMEFKSEMDVSIAEKMLQFPLLGEKIEGVWNLALTREFDMTNDSHLFYTKNAEGRLPLYEGKMIHQFNHLWKEPKYWLDEQEARKVLLGKKGQENGQSLNYQRYRLGFRDVASNTNERTMIATVLPPKIFCPHTMSLENVNQSSLTQKERLFLVALFNSYLVDYLIRQRITTHLSFFFIYNIPIPRINDKDIVIRAAKLICTTPEFDDLAKEVGLESGVTNPEERVEIRAELDAMVAHLYGLTYEEFQHILGTFPIVKDQVKDRALEKFK